MRRVHKPSIDKYKVALIVTCETEHAYWCAATLVPTGSVESFVDNCSAAVRHRSKKDYMPGVTRQAIRNCMRANNNVLNVHILSMQDLRISAQQVYGSAVAKLYDRLTVWENDLHCLVIVPVHKKVLSNITNTNVTTFSYNMARGKSEARSNSAKRRWNFASDDSKQHFSNIMSFINKYRIRGRMLMPTQYNKPIIEGDFDNLTSKTTRVALTKNNYAIIFDAVTREVLSVRSAFFLPADWNLQPLPPGNQDNGEHLDDKQDMLRITYDNELSSQACLEGSDKCIYEALSGPNFNEQTECGIVVKTDEPMQLTDEIELQPYHHIALTSGNKFLIIYIWNTREVVAVIDSSKVDLLNLLRHTSAAQDNRTPLKDTCKLLAIMHQNI